MSYDTANYRDILARHDFFDTSDWLPIEHVPEWMRLTGMPKVSVPSYMITSRREDIVQKIKKTIDAKLSEEERVMKEDFKEYRENSGIRQREIGLADCARFFGISDNLLRAICDSIGIEKRSNKTTYKFGIKKINKIKAYLLSQVLDSNNKMV
jgi:hypothetical protein